MPGAGREVGISIEVTVCRSRLIALIDTRAIGEWFVEEQECRIRDELPVT